MKKILLFLCLFCVVFSGLSYGVEVSLEKTEKEAQKTKLVPCLSHLFDLRKGPDGVFLAYPSFVCVDNAANQIYVVDSGHSRVVIYTADGYPLYVMDRNRKVEAPAGLFIDDKGFIYLCQVKTNGQVKGRISIFDPCLRWRKDMFFTGFDGAEKFIPRTVAVSRNGRIYVSGDGFKGVLVLDHEGRFLHMISPEDEILEVRGKADICAVYIDRKGRIYLLSEGYGRVYVYDADEKFLFKFAQKGGSSGKLSRPQALAVDENTQRIYVVDYLRHTVSVFDYNGKYLFEFGGKGWSPGWFQYPTYICIDTAGRVLVADTFNQRVQVLKVKVYEGIEEKIKTLRPSLPFKLRLKKKK
ncbi:MAG: 6-bladed beta-propeller [Candidatus Desulfofervidaceae bacterium]|nr:6-bladed beta-propeller [Candidatus Desulfofervidaceae bacterium]